MKIERIEHQWDSPAVYEYVEHLRGEVARAFAVPAYLICPDAYGAFQRRAYEQTALLRKEIKHLTMTYSRPVMLVSGVGQQQDRT